MSFSVIYDCGQYTFTFTSGRVVFVNASEVNFQVQQNGLVWVGDGVNNFTVDYTQCTSPFSGSVAGWIQAVINLNILVLAPGSNLSNDVGIQYRPNATGAASRYHLVSLATTNAASIKNSPGRLVGFALSNTTTTIRYVKLHNQATVPTAGVNVYMTIPLTSNNNIAISLPGGIAFTNGIGITVTNGPLDSDAVAVAASSVVGDLYFV